mmetsp:Transcript_81854/g.171210  ORF Transcript_81854/g.171210 Transcript_81854/m.171210 type:complete len:208 (-) Transcript_81854:311-934(-)
MSASIWAATSNDTSPCKESMSVDCGSSMNHFGHRAWRYFKGMSPSASSCCSSSLFKSSKVRPRSAEDQRMCIASSSSGISSKWLLLAVEVAVLVVRSKSESMVGSKTSPGTADGASQTCEVRQPPSADKVLDRRFASAFEKNTTSVSAPKGAASPHWCLPLRGVFLGLLSGDVLEDPGRRLLSNLPKGKPDTIVTKEDGKLEMETLR